MRLKSFVAALVMCLLLAPSPARADFRILGSPGGEVGSFLKLFEVLRESGERIIIDGPCLSACTLVLGIVPRERICVTQRALLGFHAAWMPGPAGKPVPSPVGTQALWEIYPQHVRRWINQRGGLSSKMVFLRGRELAAMYPRCSSSAWAR